MPSGVIALEIEWNNKDPFFDRDLENFKGLHAEGAISVGVIVTRGASMQDEMLALVRRFAADSMARSSNDSLLELASTRRRRQQAGVEQRMRRACHFAEAWSRNFVAGQVRPGHHPLAQAGGSRPSRRRQSVSAAAGRPAGGIVRFGENLDVAAIAEATRRPRCSAASLAARGHC